MRKTYVKPSLCVVQLCQNTPPICGSGGETTGIGIGDSGSTGEQPEAEASEYRPSIWED